MKEPNPAATASKLKKLSRLRPTLAMVLGSGFHHTVGELAVDAEIAYNKLPGFPAVGVSGHAGKLLIGRPANAELNCIPACTWPCPDRRMKPRQKFALLPVWALMRSA